MRVKDVRELAKLHAGVFPGYNSTCLGKHYLTALYLTLAQSPACLSIVALDGERVVGWIGGVLDYAVYNKDLARRASWRAPAILASAFIRKPALVAVGVAFVFRATAGRLIKGPVTRRLGEAASAAPSGPTAHLLVIGVDPGGQNRGLGQTMMIEFHERLRARRYAVVSLSTFVDNAAGNRAFQKAGYRLVSSEGGVNRYRKELLSRES